MFTFNWPFVSNHLFTQETMQNDFKRLDCQANTVSNIWMAKKCTVAHKYINFAD